VASRLDMTASFLPKPVTGVNGNGMHTNISISRGDTNLFHDAAGEEGLSAYAWGFVDGVLHHAKGLCLLLNASVNAYRRLDPHFEAPNQIKASPIDRGSMVRIPIGNARTARIEVRSIAPDAHPHMAIFALLHAGLSQPATAPNIRQGSETLPDNIYDAIADFRASALIAEALGSDVQGKYADLKETVADRCPRKLGTLIKRAEVQFHHEVTNQYLWSRF
jgi:glutamine synthetase